MKRSGFLASLALAALCLAVGLSGCGGNSSTAATPKKIKLAGVIFQDDQFFRLIKFGMQDAAKKYDVDLLEGNSNNKPETEQQMLENFQTKKVDAIIISPLSFKGSVAALKDAHDKGIVIVTNNTAINADFPEGDVECSNEDLGSQTGKAAVKYINEKLGGKANVAIVAFKSQNAEQSDQRTGGFKKEITALPGVKIVTEQDAWLTETSQKLVGDILTAHPEVNIVYGANEGGTSGAVLAAMDHKASKVAVFGTDVSDQLIGYLQSKDDILQAITAQKPYDMGVRSVEIALHAIKKEPYDKKVVLNGVCLSRSDPDGIAKFSEQLKQWTAGGK